MARQKSERSQELLQAKAVTTQQVDHTTGRIRCLGTTAKGRQCPMMCADGDEYCPTHDGVYGNGMTAAHAIRRELVKSAPLAVAAIEDVLTDHRSGSGDRLRAGFGLLDRIGVGPSSTVGVDMNLTSVSPLDMLIARLDAIHERKIAVEAGVAEALPADIVDAEVVGDSADPV